MSFFYERLNHLGNVQVVISDKRVSVCDEYLAVERFEAEVLSAVDYYPGGMLLPERQWYANADSGLYSFGVNGQLKDDEIAGVGNRYSAEYWQYDSRLIRRFNQDPKPNPSISNYACFANNPIWFADPDGDTIKISQSDGGSYKYTPGEDYNGTDEFVCAVVSSLNLMYNGGEAGKELVDNLNSMEEFSTIFESSSNKAIGFNVGWNPNSTTGALNEAGNLLRPAFIGLGHELGHVWDYKSGVTQSTFGVGMYDIWFNFDGTDVRQAEKYATHVENQLRAEHGIPLRTHYALEINSDGSYTGHGQLIKGTESIYFTTTTVVRLENAWTTFQDDRQSFVPFTELKSISPYKYR